MRPDGTLPAVSDLVRPCIGGSDLGEIGGSVQLEWLSDLGEIGGGSKHVETARASEGSGGGGWLAFHMSEFIESIRVSGGSGGGSGHVGHVRSLIDNIRPSGGGSGGSGYVTSTVSVTQQNVLFEQFPLLLIPGV